MLKRKTIPWLPLVISLILITACGPSVPGVSAPLQVENGTVQVTKVERAKELVAPDGTKGKPRPGFEFLLIKLETTGDAGNTSFYVNDATGQKYECGGLYHGSSICQIPQGAQGLILRYGDTVQIALGSLSAESQSVTTGESSPSPASSQAAQSTGLQEGELVTNLALSTYANQNSSLADYQGKVLIINFWSSWAAPCAELAPILEQIWRKYQAQDVAVFGVNYQDTPSNALAFVKKFGITYATGPDTGNKLAAQFKVTGVPLTLIIDKGARIAKILPGTQAITAESLAEIIDRLVKVGTASETEPARPISILRK